jgi:hypothetical protein
MNVSHSIKAGDCETRWAVRSGWISCLVPITNSLGVRIFAR